MGIRMSYTTGVCVRLSALLAQLMQACMALLHLHLTKWKLHTL
jgi:hypothetical protein